MPRRPFLTPATLAALSFAASLVPTAARADDLPDDQMSPYQFSGLINSDNVYVRSYAGETDYPVTKLNDGDGVTVVGAHGDWLKILPPPGIFCLVGKPWIEQRGDGSVGRVRDDANATVRVVSLINGEYGKVVGGLKAGQDVKIQGQQDEYYKIAPPPGVFVYVHKRFINLVKRVEVVTDNGAMVVRSAGDTPPAPPTPDNTADKTVPTTQPDNLVPVPPITTQPPIAVAPQGPGSTQPTTMTASAVTTPQDFEALEARFLDASKLPLQDQPLDELKAGYEQAAADKSLSDQTQKIADYRLKAIALRKDAADNLKASDAERKAREAQAIPLAAEAQEIGERIKANQFKRYNAVGTLRASALPYNGKTLYRLTDPSTGRTVIYLATEDAKIIAMDGQFIGVRGTISDDATRQIKLLTPESAETVDPAEIRSGAVTSALVPASLATADAGH